MRYRNHSWRRNFGRTAFFALRKSRSFRRRSSSFGLARASSTRSFSPSSSSFFFGFFRRAGSFAGFSSAFSSFSGSFGSAAFFASRAAFASSFVRNARRRFRSSSTLPSVLSSYLSDHATSSAFFAARTSAAVGRGPRGSGGFSGSVAFLTFFAGFGSSSAILCLPGLLRDVDAVLEDPRIEAPDPRRQLDIRGGLTNRFDVRSAEEHLVAFHLDLRLSDDPRLPRELLPQEVFDDELGPLDGRLDREMTVHDLHLVLEALRHADDHVPEVGRERPHESALPPPREFAADLRLFPVDEDPDARMGQRATQRVALAGDDHEVAFHADLHVRGNVDQFLLQSCDRHRPPQ